MSEKILIIDDEQDIADLFEVYFKWAKRFCHIIVRAQCQPRYFIRFLNFSR